jgi:hypothetical protein
MMGATYVGDMSARERLATIETAAEHATSHVPVAAPADRVGAVRESLVGHR